MRQPKPELEHYFRRNSWESVFDDPLCGTLEALLWAADHPLSVEEIRQVLSSEGEEVLSQQIVGALRELAAYYNRPGRGLQLVEVAGGWQFRTPEKYAPLVQKLFQLRPPKLSRAAMECLAIVAYRQPITRAEIDEIRGVDSSGVLRSLLEKKLIEPVGRQDSPGRPFLYGTTKFFLEFFGLKDLHQLPSLKSFLDGERDDNK